MRVGHTHPDVGHLPDDFVADIRRLEPHPSLTDSLWRSPLLVELTYGRLWQLVAEVLPTAPTRVLDVGSGTGVLSLELARLGHDVSAIDPDPAAIGVARRSAADCRPGRLSYAQADLDAWEPGQANFDVVVTTRVLHHVDDPAVAVDRMRSWLRPGGRLVCVDFVHDRFDRRAATWMAQTRSLLQAAGVAADRALLPTDPAAAVEHVEAEWEREHVLDHDLNPADQILEALRHRFHDEVWSWHPYLYWDVLVDVVIDDPRTEARLAPLVAAWEASLLTEAELPGVLFRFVGEAP
jgi:2-polyprenyl-3-methyl-5-hydroxy-6-metoxy-1,4-benzoquinol methylase